MRMDILALEQSLATNPDDVATLINLANAYLLTQNYQQAIPHYQHALRLRPDDAAILVRLWGCQQQAGITSYRSQQGEDLWIATTRNLPHTGVFVDVGAEDGITASNTYHFEQSGWTGICIEPNPVIFPVLQATRTCRCIEAAIGNDPTQPFYIHPKKGWSGLINEGTGAPHGVAIRRLDEILAHANINHIDLLSIDTEGTELDVLETIDLRKYAPAIIIIEWNTWDGQINSKAAIESYFATRPYTLVLCTQCNLIFTKDV
jgi:FkbM family methyltransferase